MPSVRSAMKSFARSFFFSITWIMALINATLVPGLICKNRSAYSHRGIRRGSTTTSLAPLALARMILEATMGCWPVVLLPITMMQSAFSISGTELVIAPLPNAAARPATVELCQSRAQ